MKTFVTIHAFFLTVLFATPCLHAQWTASSGPLGGDVEAFVYTTGTVFAGTAGGGVFRQSNRRWVYSGNGLDGWAAFVSDFARVDSAVFAATFGGVYKTTDDGQSWFESGNGLPDKPVHAIERHNGILYVGLDSGGVFRSTDLGWSWTAANGGLTTFIPVNRLSFLGDFVFAGTAGDGVWFTDDYGTRWTKLETGIPRFNEYILSLHAVAGRIYAGIYGYGIYYQALTGGGWQPANTGLLSGEVYAFTALSTTFYCGTEDGVHWSTNWGGNWVPSSDSMRNKRVRALVADGVDVLAGTYGGGIYRQASAWAPWEKQNDGLKAAVISQLAMTDPYDGYIYACTFGLGLYRKDTLGGGWEDITPGFQDGAMEVNRFYNRGDTIYVATNSGVFYSVNHGTTWVHHDWGMSASPITALVFDENEILASTWYKGVYRNTDLSSYWNAYNYGLPNSSGNDFNKVSDMIMQGDSAFIAMEPNRIFRRNKVTDVWDTVQAVGMDLAGILRFAENDSILYVMGYTGLYYSTDYGETWAPDTLGLSGINVRSMRLSKDNPQAFGYYAHIITEDGRLFFQDSAFGRWREEPTNNNGFMVDMLSDARNSYGSFYGKGVWTTAPFPVELSTFSGFAFDESTNILEWRTESETNNRGFDVMRSLDGSNWEKRGFVPGIGTTTERHDYTYEDPARQDCWYRLRQQDFDGTISYSPMIEIRKKVLPGDYNLEAYPNPFHDAATIAFTAQEDGAGTVRILDVTGRVVYEESVMQRIGSRISVRWNPASSATPPGTYIIALRGADGGLQATTRIVKR